MWQVVEAKWWAGWGPQEVKGCWGSREGEGMPQLVFRCGLGDSVGARGTEEGLTFWLLRVNMKTFPVGQGGCEGKGHHVPSVLVLDNLPGAFKALSH